MSLDRKDLEQVHVAIPGLVDQLKELITAHARNRPLFIAVDDTHWADEFTMMALRTLVPDLSEQIWRNSQILILKYARLKYAFICFGGAAVAWAATLVLLPA